MAQRPRQPETVNSDLHRRKGPTLVVLPSYGRDGLDDFDNFTGRIADAAGASCAQAQRLREARMPMRPYAHSRALSLAQPSPCSGCTR